MGSGDARAFYDANDAQRCGRDQLPKELETTRRWMREVAPPIRGAVVELGCGRGPLSTVSEHHVGIDLSFRAVASRPEMRGCVADMQGLPLANESAAFVFSWASLEHVPHPESVLHEIERVVKPGGIALVAPAWHCRPWAAEGLEFRPYSSLAMGQKFRKFVIPVRNLLLFRAPGEIVRRLWSESLAATGRQVPFPYRRLQPNLTEYVGTDCDAFTSMDPHAMITYFRTRGWEVLSHRTAAARLLARHEPVVIRKPERRS